MPNVELIERRLNFKFNNWDLVFTFDETEKFKKLNHHSMKGSDIVGLFGNMVMILEVKDFRDYYNRKETQDKLANKGELLISDIIEKVKGTILTAMSRMYPQFHTNEFEKISDAISNQKINLYILLWVEFFRIDEENSEIMIKRNKAELENLMTTLKSKLSWLTKYVDVVNNVSGSPGYGITVDYIK